MEGLTVSVVICAFTEDRWPQLVAAVSSAQRQSLPPREVIVVIDHCPRLVERVRTELRGVVALENTLVSGASGARNTGVAAASGDLVAFLDDDAAADRGWLAALCPVFADPRVIGAGGALEPGWPGARPSWFPREFDWVVGCTYRGMPESKARVRNLIAANMIMRREAFEALGGFRAGFGKVGTRLGCDETELCIRASQRWPKVIWVYEPSAKVTHRVPVGRARPGYFGRRCFDEGLAKGQLARLVGAKDGLASERAYTQSVIPRGVVRGVADAILRGDPSGLARAAAIIMGLISTSAGYLAGRLKGREIAAARPSSRRVARA